jgi:hypothetical protein
MDVKVRKNKVQRRIDFPLPSFRNSPEQQWNKPNRVREIAVIWAPVSSNSEQK